MEKNQLLRDLPKIDELLKEDIVNNELKIYNENDCC